MQGLSKIYNRGKNPVKHPAILTLRHYMCICTHSRKLCKVMQNDCNRRQLLPTAGF